MKNYQKSLTQFLFGIVRVYGSNFKVFKFSIYPFICLTKTHLHKNYIEQ